MRTVSSYGAEIRKPNIPLRLTMKTYRDYILRMRMERAKDLLTSTSEKVTSIAQRLGYNNDSYFIKTFRGMVGVTPYEYRKQTHNSRKKEVTL